MPPFKVRHKTVWKSLHKNFCEKICIINKNTMTKVELYGKITHKYSLKYKMA